MARAALASETLPAFLAARAAAPDEGRPAALATLPPTATLADATAVLARARVLSAPVVDAGSGGGLRGVVEVADVLSSLLAALEADGGGGAWEARLAAAAPAALAPTLASLPAVAARSDAWHAGDRDATLLELVTDGLLRARRARGAAAASARRHRAPVFAVSPGPPSPDGPAIALRVVDIVSCSDAVAWLWARREELAAAFAAPLAAAGLPAAPALTAPASRPAIAVFQAMAEASVSAAALVAPDGSLVGCLSASDLRGLDAASLTRLASPASELAAGGGPPVAVPATATLGDVTRAVVAARVHRAFVVGPHDAPVGVVGLGDLLAALVGQGEGV
jgi:CBS domain-containing protein